MGREAFLLRVQRNAVFKVVAAEGFNPDDFRWEVIRRGKEMDDWYEAFFHSQTRYCVLFNYPSTKAKGGRCCILYPGKESLETIVPARNWEAQLSCLKDWLKYVRREMETPNYWAKLARHAGELATVPDAGPTGGDYFNEDDKTHMREAIRGIEQRLREVVGDNQDALRIVNGEASYFIGASERLVRRDWLLMAVGGLVNIATILELEPAVLTELLARLRESFPAARTLFPK